MGHAADLAADACLGEQLIAGVEDELARFANG